MYGLNSNTHAMLTCEILHRYVDFDLAQITASVVQNMEQYISNQHHHSALRKESEFILKKLFGLARREYD